MFSAQSILRLFATLYSFLKDQMNRFLNPVSTIGFNYVHKRQSNFDCQASGVLVSL